MRPLPAVLLALLPTIAAAERLPRLPLHFIPNVGQADPAVAFMVKGAGPDLYFASDEIVLAEPPGECGPGSVVRLRFEGASPAMRLEALQTTTGVAHFYLGNVPEAWREHVPMSGGVAYRDAWPGIDAVYRGTSGRLKAEFEVAPGADVSSIRLAFEGVTALRLRRDGALVLSTPTGELVEEAPISWEEGSGGRRFVSSRFVLLGDHRVGLVVDGRDPSAPLVVDPVLDYSSFIGGSAEDEVTDVLWQGTGLFACGRTRSPDFPITSGVGPGPGSWDAYYVRTRLETATSIVTFYGGSGDESPFQWGGTTTSPDLPTLRARQPAYGGNGDIYLLDLDVFTGALRLATYAGGSERDEALTSCGVGLAGRTWSPDFPTSLAAHDARLDGASDGVILNLDGDATLIGGSGDDAVTACHSSLYAGWTTSADFPRGLTPGPGAPVGGRDVFVAHLTGSGLNNLSSLQTSSLIGGSADDEPTAVLRGGEGHVLGGVTTSPDFPLRRPIQGRLAGRTDGFVAVVNADVLTFSDYVGGTGDDHVAGLAGTPLDVLLIAGTTSSADLPLMLPLQAGLAGPTDAFVMKINPHSTPTRILWSTHLGGAGSEIVRAARPGPEGCIVFGGATDGADFPVNRAVQPGFGGSGDGFVSRVCETDVLRQQDTGIQLVEIIERTERIEERLVHLDLSDIRGALARLEACCDLTQGKLDDLLDFSVDAAGDRARIEDALGRFSTDATDRLVRIEDLLARFEGDATERLIRIEELLRRLDAEREESLLRDIEESLFERRCLAWLWLPEAEGHLALARSHLERRLEEAVATRDPDVNEPVARARLRSADQSMAAGELQEACKRMTDAYHAITMP